MIVMGRLNTVRQLGLGRRVGRLRTTMIGGVGVASLVGGVLRLLVRTRVGAVIALVTTLDC